MLNQKLNIKLRTAQDVAMTDPQISAIHLSPGVTLNYMEQGDQNGEVVILLHGYSDSLNSFAPILPLLSRQYHVFAPDQRGHGESSKPSCCYTMADFASDVIAFMDAKEIDRATLVGHSAGSLIAQWVAIHHANRVSRLVLVGASAVGSNEAVEELNRNVQTLVDPVDPEFVTDFQLSTLYNEVSPEFLEKVISESLKLPADVWHQVAASIVATDFTHDLARITAPTLIVWGAQDSIFVQSDQEMLRDMIANSTLLTYPETGHALHWERPEQFVSDLEIFMQTTHG